MAIIDIITELFCRVDDAMTDVPHHSQQALSPSELVTIGLLYAIKGVGSRYFYRWLSANYRDMFPNLPSRSRLFRRLRTRRAWTERFLITPGVLGVIDSYGIELLHPVREGRRPGQIGKKGLSNHRWIVGGKLCIVLDGLGRVSAWDCDSANVHDTRFAHLIERFEGQTIVLGDWGFHRAKGDSPNFKLCRRGEWNERMGVETVLSMLTVMCHIKHMRHRVWEYFEAKIAYLLAAFNILVQWNGLEPDGQGRVRLSIAQFTL